MKRNKTLSLAILSGLAVIASVPAWSFFTGYSWITGSGNWSNSAKWSPTGIPNGAGDSATISAVGTYTVTLDSARSVDSVTISNASATLALGAFGLTLLQPAGLNNSGTITSTSGSITGSITNNAAAFITLNAGQNLTVSSSALVNNGTITINFNQASADSVLNFSGTSSISGSGAIQMSQNGTWAQLNSGAGISVTNGSSHTIRGRGLIGASLINNGTVLADWGASALVLNGQNKTNNGNFKATVGTLVIDGITVAQSGVGQLSSDGGTVAVRNGAVISGGAYNLVSTGQLLFDSGNATIHAMTLNGPANIMNGRVITVGTAPLGNNGTLTINSNAAGSDTVLHFENDTAINGTGTIQMSQNGTWAQLTSASGKVVTNTAAHTIKGRGLISAQMINNGTIHADWGGSTLTLLGGSKTNAGMIKVSGGTPVLGVDGCAINQSGAGQLLADGANIGLRNSGSISGGALNSVGASNGFFCDAGDFNLANLTTNGRFNIQGGRTVNVGAGLFTNNGLFNINYNAAGSITSLNFTESLAITGNGTIQMSQEGTWSELASAAGKIVTNGASHTIKGRGQITAELVNNGNILADWSPGTLALKGGAKTNNLMMKTGSPSSVLSVDGCSLTQGVIGKLFAENGDAALRNGAIVTGGTLDSASTFGIYVDQGNARIGSLTNAGKLSVQGGRTLEVSAGALVNNGTINLNYNSAGSVTIMNFLDDVTISGSGTVQMSQAGTWADIATAPGKTVTNGANHIFKGRGRISGAFVNNGLVSSDWGSDTLELMGSAKTNNATMKAAGSSAVLSIRDCVVNQSPTARIWAEGSNVGIRGTATINGGRLESQPTFGHYVDSGAPTVSGVTNAGTVNIQHGMSLNIGANGLTNNGSMTLNYTQGGSITKMSIPASATIGGTGTIQMSQAGTWAQVEVAPGQTLTHDIGHTIKGRGQINGGVLNKGNIFADWGSASLDINPAAPGFINQGAMGINLNIAGMTINSANLFTNQGAVNVITGSTMTANGGDYSQTAGTTTIDGTLTITGGNKVNLTGGILKGSGIVNAPVLNTGTGNVEPGNSAGKLRVQGAYNQPSTGTLTIELGGTTPVTQHDVLEVTGVATLAGKLKLRLINAFIPSPGQVFTILTAGSVSGNFIEKIQIENGSVEMEAVAFGNGNTVQVAFMTKVAPTSFAVTAGLHFGGVLSSLFNSDNDRLFVLCDSDDSIGIIEVTTTSPISTVGKLRFAYEGSAVRTDLTEIVSLWSYTANQWLAQDPILQSTVIEKRTVMVAGGNPQQYVKPGTLEMKAQMIWIPNSDLVAFDGWSMRADQLVWYVAP